MPDEAIDAQDVSDAPSLFEERIGDLWILSGEPGWTNGMNLCVVFAAETEQVGWIIAAPRATSFDVMFVYVWTSAC